MAVNKVIYGGNTLVDLTGDTVTAADLADGVKATGADGNPVIGLMQKVTIDAELSTTSTNPVQNKVIKEALDGKLGKNETAARATQDGAGNTISTTYASKADVSALLSTKLGVNSTAYAATRDGAGNNIVATYAKKTDISGMVKSVNGTAPDANGNVEVGAGATVVESYRNGTEWYRIWSDGWIEQGGYGVASGSGKKKNIVLLKPYIDSSYTITLANLGGTHYYEYDDAWVSDKTSASFNFNRWGAYAFNWYVCGQGA